MDGSLVDAFREQAAERGIETTLVDRDGASEAIRDAIEFPAVGSPLLTLDVSLPEPVITDPSADQLESARTGITAATVGVTSEGAIVIEESPAKEGPVSLFPPRQIAALRTEDLVADVPDLFELLGESFADGRDDAVVVAGPSATSDMGELVTGVHGPETVHVILVEP